MLAVPVHVGRPTLSVHKGLWRAPSVGGHRRRCRKDRGLLALLALPAATAKRETWRRRKNAELYRDSGSVGRVCAVEPQKCAFALELLPGAVQVPLRCGAGLVFDSEADFGEDAELGGKIAKLRLPGKGNVESSEGLEEGSVLLLRLDWEGHPEKQRRMAQMAKLEPGTLVWRNKDEHLEEQVRQLSLVNMTSLQDPSPVRPASSLDHRLVAAALARLAPTAAAPEKAAPGAFERPAAPRLTVLCRTAAQAEAVLQLPPGLVYELQLDFLEAQGLQEAVAAAKAQAQRVAVCLPRILKPKEDGLCQFYQRLNADAILVRGSGALLQLQEDGAELIGDFSLNVANAVSATHFYLSRDGLARLTPTHDLNAQQICGLAKRLGPLAQRLEVVAHQHLPIFHTEHCVFARFLSKGNDYTDCGHPCERDGLHLRDSNGKETIRSWQTWAAATPCSTPRLNPPRWTWQRLQRLAWASCAWSWWTSLAPRWAPWCGATTRPRRGDWMRRGCGASWPL
ncbi:unnamed protein product [Effrenium voratum]|nr:unnamed protein product [Effrenium voratum]